MTIEGKQFSHYLIHQLIGKGGMGEVYLAEDIQTHRQLAIKVIAIEVGQSNQEITTDVLRLFWREATAIANLDHPAILPLYDHGETNIDGFRFAYLVIPYRSEGSLATWLNQRAQVLQTNQLTLRQVMHIVQQAGQALQYAHDHQIMHLDVKPANFLIRKRSETNDYPDLLLSDFGIARLGSTTSSASQNVRGTPTYMAPEQWAGQPGFASDQYALAIMVYELLIGNTPFQGAPMNVMYAHIHNQPKRASEHNSLLPPTVDLVLLRALAKKPEERFPSVATFVQAFQSAFQGMDEATTLRVLRPSQTKPTPQVASASSSADIRATLAISMQEAQSGAVRTLTLTNGRRVNVQIPAGAQHGQTLVLIGQGDVLAPNTWPGNLYLTLSVIDTSPQVFPASSDHITVHSSPFVQTPPLTPTGSQTPPPAPTVTPPPFAPNIAPNPFAPSSAPNPFAPSSAPNPFAPSSAPNPFAPSSAPTSAPNTFSPTVAPPPLVSNFAPNTLREPAPASVLNIRGFFIALFCLILLIASGGGIWLYVMHQNQNQPSVKATVTNVPTTIATTPVSSLGTPGAYTCVPGNLVISGSTALLPLVTKVAMDYTTRCTSATITVQGGGSSIGKTQVEAGQVGIGDSDTLASAGQTDLVDHQVNVVIFGIIVNYQTSVTNLTTAQIQGIYNGTYSNWNQVGGTNLPIVVISRPTSSGTRATFAQYVLGMNEQVSGPSHLVSDATSTIVTEVGQTAGAIGYAATGQVPAGSGASIISIDGNLPSTTNVESNAYKFWNIEHMFTKGQPIPLEQALIDYIDSSQGLVEQATLQFVPLTQMQPAAITAHNAVPLPSS
jgi:eukaryotic-like serine/threonine-protein kinase